MIGFIPNNFDLSVIEIFNLKIQDSELRSINRVGSIGAPFSDRPIPTPTLHLSSERSIK